MSSAPPPAAGQVWVKTDSPRDQDQIVAVKPTTLPGVELITWGGRGPVHTLVWPDQARSVHPYGLGHTEVWPPPERFLK